MYESYFGLSRSPFRLTPDPVFFYQTAQHRKALACLEFGRLQQEGFVALIGNAGMGKTLIAKSIAETESGPNQVAYVSGYPCDDQRLYLSIADALNVRDIDHTAPRSTIFGAIKRHLTEAYDNGQRISLTIDDAHRIPTSTFSELEPLLDLESGCDALMQITLVGTPGLRDQLASAELLSLIHI